MATVTENVRDIVYLVEREPRSSVGCELKEVYLVGDVITSKTATIVREVLTANDAAQYRVYLVQRDTAYVNDAQYRVVRTGKVVRETLLANEILTYGVRVSQTITETLSINDYSVGSAKVVLREKFLINDTLSLITHVVRSLRETFISKSRAVVPITANVRETALLADAYAGRVRYRFTVRDTAGGFNDPITFIAHSGGYVREVATLNDVLRPALYSSPTLRELAYVSDIVVPPPYGRAYTCSVRTWGMSVLTNFPFTTMAGNYGSHNNLWRLDAEDDYGVPITWNITTGKIDMKSAEKKRVSAIYVAGSADAPITVTVVGDVDGVKQEYDYDLELRDQTDYRNNRTLVGKGFHSRFFQVKLGATGVPARLITADADVAVSERRL